MTAARDVEQYRFADRFVAARAWAVASRLVLRHPELLVSGVINEERTPLLIVHDASELLHIQFDLVAWILVGPEDHVVHRYWDEVFSDDDPLETVRWAEHSCGLAEPEAELDCTARSVVYAAIAGVLASGVDDECTWQATRVKLNEPDQADTDTLAAFPNGPAVGQAVLADVEERVQVQGAVWFHEPLWALWCDGAPVVLLDCTTGQAHVRTGHSLDLLDMAQRADGDVTRAVSAVIRSALPTQPTTLPGSGQEADARPAIRVLQAAVAILDGSSWQAWAARTLPDWQVLNESGWNQLAADLKPEQSSRASAPDEELEPIADRLVAAQAWHVAAAIERRTGLQLRPGRSPDELLRLLDTSGNAVVTLSNDAVTAADLYLDWFDVFALPFAFDVPDQVIATIGSPGSPGDRDPRLAVHATIARLLAMMVDDAEPLRVVGVDPTAGASKQAGHQHAGRWLILRGGTPIAILDDAGAGATSTGSRFDLVALQADLEDPALVAGHVLDLALSPLQPSMQGPPRWRKVALPHDLPRALYVNATVRADGSIVIEGQDLSGPEYEYVLTVPADQAPTLLAALDGRSGQDVLELLVQHGAEIVRHGESQWLTEHGLTPTFWSHGELW